MWNVREYEDEKEYQEKFILFSQKLEKGLKRAVFVCSALLFLAQFMLTFDHIRIFLVPVEKMEGNTISNRPIP